MSMISVINFISLLFVICSAVEAKTSIIEDRIVGGTPTDIEDVPYQVSVIGLTYFCGGCLIKLDWIVTAAHCLDGKLAVLINVRAGSSHINDGGVVRKGLKKIIHPQYNAETNDYDVGLLKVISKFPNNRNDIKTIPLLSILPDDGEVLKISGYGTTSEGGTLSDSLQSALVYKVNFSICNVEYGSGLTERMFCAKNEGKDTCQGDSGGPIAHEGSLAGITSFGIGCADPKYPGVYTSIPSVVNWITDNSV